MVRSAPQRTCSLRPSGPPARRPCPTWNDGRSSRYLLDKFGAPGRVGARPGTGDRCDQAGKLERRAEFVALESQAPAQAAVVMEPCQERRPKGIAGPDGVDNL